MAGRLMFGLALLTVLSGCGAVPADETVSTNAVDTASPPARSASEATLRRSAAPLALAPPSPRADTAAAFVAGPQGWSSILYLCDPVDASPVYAISTDRMWSFAKPDMTGTTKTISLGAEDAGAGSIWRDVRRDGTAIGAVRSINPGMLGPPEATTLPTVSGVRFGARETRCRWLPRARLLVVTTRRSAMIVQQADGTYTYRSFDHDKPGRVTEGGEAGTSSTPTAEVRGGALIAASAGREIYTFAAAPWTYRVEASARTDRPGATITVLKDGRAVSRADAIAYEMAAARIG